LAHRNRRARLLALGAIKADVSMSDLQKVAEDSLRRAGYLDKFIHGFGHSVGLDVHDVCLYDAPIPAGPCCSQFGSFGSGSISTWISSGSTSSGWTCSITTRARPSSFAAGSSETIRIAREA